MIELINGCWEMLLEIPTRQISQNPLFFKITLIHILILITIVISSKIIHKDMTTKKEDKTEKKLRKIHYVIGITIPILMLLVTVYVVFFQNPQSIIIDNSENQNPFLFSNLTSYYNIERENEIEKYTVSVINNGSKRANDLTIHITFPENMTIKNLHRFSKQRIFAESGGIGYNYYNVWYYYIYSNETIDVSLQLNNDDFIDNKSLKIIPITEIFYDEDKIIPIYKL